MPNWKFLWQQLLALAASNAAPFIDSLVQEILHELQDAHPAASAHLMTTPVDPEALSARVVERMKCRP